MRVVIFCIHIYHDVKCSLKLPEYSCRTKLVRPGSASSGTKPINGGGEGPYGGA